MYLFIVALNIFALIMVLAFLAGSVWLISRFSTQRKKIKIPLDGDFEVDTELAENHLECSSCNGTGAESRLGEIYTCTSCEGTGIVGSPSQLN